MKEALWWVVKKALDNIEMILSAIVDGLIKLVAEALDVILEPVLEIMLYAPAPETGGHLFAPPTNAPWTQIFGPLWSVMVPIGLALLVVSYFAAELVSSVPVGSPAAARQREFGLLTGLFIIPLSRYVIALFLQTMQALTELLTPQSVVSLSDLAAVNSGAAGIAMLLLAFLSVTVYIAMLAVHVVRIIGVVMIAGAAPVLFGLYLGRFPVLDGVAKSLLRGLPVLGFAPVLLALAMRVMTAIFAADGGINIDGLGVAGVVVEPLFLVAPGLLGLALPVILVRSVSTMASPSAAGTQGKMSTPKTVSKAKQAGVREAKQDGLAAAEKARSAPSRVKSRLDQRAIRRDVESDDGSPSDSGGMDQDGSSGPPNGGGGGGTGAGGTDTSAGGAGISTETTRDTGTVERSHDGETFGRTGSEQTEASSSGAEVKNHSPSADGDESTDTRGVAQARVDEALARRFSTIDSSSSDSSADEPTDSDQPTGNSPDS